MENNKIFLLSGMEIRRFSAVDAHEIDKASWAELSSNCIFTNPFFSQSWLLPSINYFVNDDSVEIIVVYKEGELVGLFPVKKFYIKKGFSFLMVWQHNHSFLVDPLMKVNFDFFQVFQAVATKMKCYAARIHKHDAELSNSNFNSCLYSTMYTRAHINNTNLIEHYLAKNNNHFFKENRRLERKAKKDLDLSFFQYRDISVGFEDFCELEHAGWKGRSNGSISSCHNVLAFYREVIGSQWGSESIKFIGLNAVDESIACAIRVVSENKYYEIKTCFNEGYKAYAPGRLLEYLVLQELSQYVDVVVDSCTDSENLMINKMWPDQKKIISTLVFSKTFIGRIFSFFYKIKWMIKNRND